MLTPVVLFIFNMVKCKLFVEHFNNNLVSVEKLKGIFFLEKCLILWISQYHEIII